MKSTSTFVLIVILLFTNSQLTLANDDNGVSNAIAWPVAWLANLWLIEYAKSKCTPLQYGHCPYYTSTFATTEAVETTTAEAPPESTKPSSDEKQAEDSAQQRRWNPKHFAKIAKDGIKLYNTQRRSRQQKPVKPVKPEKVLLTDRLEVHPLVKELLDVGVPRRPETGNPLDPEWHFETP